MEHKLFNNILAKSLKYIFFISIFLFLLAVIISSSINFLYKEDLKKISLNYVNKKLYSPIKVKDIEVGFVSYFPSISISLKHVKILDVIDSKDTLLYCKNLDLTFNAIDLVNKQYKVRKVRINQGFFNAKITENGLHNYSFIKDQNDVANNDFKFILDQVSLRNFTINYENKILNQDYSISCKEAQLKGNFEKKSYNLDIKSDLTINHFKSGNVNYISGKKANFNSVLNVNNSPFSIKINNGTLTIAKMNFRVSGNYESSKDDRIDFSINGDNIQLSDVFSVFPVDYFSVLDKYSSKGILKFNSKLTGNLKQDNQLLFIADFNAENASFTDIANNLSMSNISLNGRFNNLKKFVDINDFSADMMDSKLKGSFLIKEFNNPIISLKTQGRLNLDKLNFFLSKNPFDFKGFASFNLSSELTMKNQFIDVKFIKGNVNSDKARVIYKPENTNIEIEDIKINMPNNDLMFSSKQANIDGDTFVPAIKLYNWLDIINDNTNKIRSDFNLDFKTLNLENWLKYFPENDSQNNTMAFDISGSLKIDNFYYEKIRFKNALLNGIYIQDNISVKSLKMEGQDGEYLLKISTSDYNLDEITIKVDGTTTNINQKKLFDEFQNFNQNWITTKNIKGILSSKFNASFTFDQNKNLISEKSKLQSLNQFKDFSIVNFPFFRQILNYFKENSITNKIIDVEYFNNNIDDVIFEDFNTEISIDNDKVFIEKTKINNNILDLSFFGTYGFNDTVDYHLNFNFNDLRKNKRNYDGLDIEDDNLGKQLFLLIFGHLENLKYKIDRDEIKKNRKEKIKKEKKIVTKIIKGENINSDTVFKKPVFELEQDIDEKSSGDSAKINNQKLKTKKKRDSTKLNKFLKKLGVEEEVKEKPKFEINN